MRSCRIKTIGGFLVTSAWRGPQVANGGDGLHIWKVPANILNKQSRTDDKGWASSMEVGHGTSNSTQ
jgi:hypothetical protein